MALKADNLPIADIKEEIFYPTSDGKPMGESQVHVRCLLHFLELLMEYFEGEDVFVAGDLLLYYEEGNPRRFLVPDIFVIRDHPVWDRPIFKLWEEKRYPEFIMEITSPTTKKADLVKKKNIYETWGVLEYVLYDPLAEYLPTPLMGYRLENGRYVEMQTNSQNGLTSEVLGFTLRLNKSNLEVIEPDGTIILRRSEQAKRIEQEKLKLQKKNEQLQDANSLLKEQVATLMAELEKRAKDNE